MLALLGHFIFLITKADVLIFGRCTSSGILLYIRIKVWLMLLLNILRDKLHFAKCILFRFRNVDKIISLITLLFFNYS